MILYGLDIVGVVLLLLHPSPDRTFRQLLQSQLLLTDRCSPHAGQIRPCLGPDLILLRLGWNGRAGLFVYSVRMYRKSCPWPDMAMIMILSFHYPDLDFIDVVFVFLLTILYRRIKIFFSPVGYFQFKAQKSMCYIIIAEKKVFPKYHVLLYVTKGLLPEVLTIYNRGRGGGAIS